MHVAPKSPRDTEMTAPSSACREITIDRESVQSRHCWISSWYTELSIIALAVPISKVRGIMERRHPWSVSLGLGSIMVPEWEKHTYRSPPFVSKRIPNNSRAKCDTLSSVISINIWHMLVKYILGKIIDMAATMVLTFHGQGYLLIEFARSRGKSAIASARHALNRACWLSGK